VKHAWLAFAFALLGCQGAPQAQPTERAAASSSAAAPASAAASAAPAPSAWFLGRWQGSYQAELRRIETSAGGVKEWKKDEGTHASGPGQLSLEAKPDGSVTGSASGALGEQTVTGHIEGDRVALTLTSSEPNGFRGTIIGAQEGVGIRGTLSASSGDSLSVRQAAVTLQRAAAP
jgi:hypothetical protein